MIRRPPRSPLFPSPPLFRSRDAVPRRGGRKGRRCVGDRRTPDPACTARPPGPAVPAAPRRGERAVARDRPRHAGRVGPRGGGPVGGAVAGGGGPPPGPLAAPPGGRPPGAA